MRLGRNEKHAIEFIRRVNGWHTYSGDRATLDAVRSLARKGLVELNQYRQFRSLTKSDAGHPDNVIL